VQRASDQSLAASYIGGDEVNAGRLQMEQALEAVGGEGEIAVLYGPMGSDAQLARKQGYDAVLADNPDVSVAFEQSGNWVTAEALNLVENWLSTGTEIAAVVAQNDGMAVGAVQAIENAGKTGEIQVFGIDATEDGVAAIESGGLAGTVSQDTAGVGELGVETMADIIAGEDVPDEVLTEAQWITAENLDDLK
jgi:ribose transport system substrate-binding protein/inositol transport system substrate-binding protein